MAKKPVHVEVERRKTHCPITRLYFREKAKPMSVVIEGIPVTAEVKEFSTGSMGWYVNGKIQLRVGDKVVSVQLGMNLTVVGSKELPNEEEENEDENGGEE